ncbi:MAG: MarR family transcriptional regulator [Comamonadaceae bacterium]|nr:MAG: MarR family transcriptional regulator [Comamonadaceae bacterium]
MASTGTPREKTAARNEPEPAARVLRRFRLVFNAVRTHFRAVETRAGISGAQLWALSVVQAQPGIGVGGLAQAMDVHQSTASNLLRALLEAGLVVSAKGEEDRRAVRLQLTARGRRVLAKAPGPFSGVLPEALSRLDKRTLARLERDLGAVIEELGADEGGANIPLGSDGR